MFGFYNQLTSIPPLPGVIKRFIESYFFAFLSVIYFYAQTSPLIYIRGFARQPCCMAGTIGYFPMRKIFLRMQNIFIGSSMQHGGHAKPLFMMMSSALDNIYIGT